MNKPLLTGSYRHRAPNPTNHRPTPLPDPKPPTLGCMKAPPPQPPTKQCRTCGRVLQTIRNARTNELTYTHPPSDRTVSTPDGVLDIEPHEPDPIPLTHDARLRCDFCSDAKPTWRHHPTGPINLASKFEDPDGPQHWSADDWLACETCHRLIETNQWNGVTRRALNMMKARTADPKVLAGIEDQLRTTYRALRKLLTHSSPL